VGQDPAHRRIAFGIRSLGVPINSRLLPRLDDSDLPLIPQDVSPAESQRLISDEEQLREFEMMELQEEFAENELRWRRKTDYKAAERANAAEAKLVKWFMEGWEDRTLAAKAWGWYRLRLLYEHKAEA
jgi:hypothetical protein